MQQWFHDQNSFDGTDDCPGIAVCNGSSNVAVCASISMIAVLSERARAVKEIARFVPQVTIISSQIVRMNPLEVEALRLQMLGLYFLTMWSVQNK